MIWSQNALTISSRMDFDIFSCFTISIPPSSSRARCTSGMFSIRSSSRSHRATDRICHILGVHPSTSPHLTCSNTLLNHTTLHILSYILHIYMDTPRISPHIPYTMAAAMGILCRAWATSSWTLLPGRDTISWASV
jgi:hypothetical protein